MKVQQRSEFVLGVAIAFVVLVATAFRRDLALILPLVVAGGAVALLRFRGAALWPRQEPGAAPRPWDELLRTTAAACALILCMAAIERYAFPQFPAFFTPSGMPPA